MRIKDTLLNRAWAELGNVRTCVGRDIVGEACHGGLFHAGLGGRMTKEVGRTEWIGKTRIGPPRT